MTRRAGRLGSGVVAALSASVLLALPAHADEQEIGGSGVSVSVQIDPLECATGCGGGSLPGTELPATGLGSIEPVLWIAMALVAAGALFALRTRTARQSRALSPSAPSTAYAVVSGEHASAVEHPSPQGTATRRTTERGDRA